MLTDAKKSALLALIGNGQGELAINKCLEWVEDFMVEKLLTEFGFTTIQLNPDPFAKERILWSRSNDATIVRVGRIGSDLYVRLLQDQQLRRIDKQSSEFAQYAERYAIWM